MIEVEPEIAIKIQARARRVPNRNHTWGAALPASNQSGRDGWLPEL